MDIFELLSPKEVGTHAEALFHEERTEHKDLHGWFLLQEIAAQSDRESAETNPELQAAVRLEKMVRELPLDISAQALLAGTQRDAFAASYALINPAFDVKTFRGYCDPLEVYDYVKPSAELPAERIRAMRQEAAQTPFVKALNGVYAEYSEYTDEVAFFFESVTGHVIPDFRLVLQEGLRGRLNKMDERLAEANLPEKKRKNFLAMRSAMQSAILLAHRYADIAAEQAQSASPLRRRELALMERNLRRVPEFGARGLMEAMQSFLILWEVMCIEQAPNPFAFSVGNADRIFEPYRAMSGYSREQAAALFKHFLVFYNVGERSWAISQNVLLSGRDLDGSDLTNEMSYAILDAYYAMNFPQPILSVKLHKNTPEKLYREMGRFLFTPGCLTPSFFNDDSLFLTLQEHGVEKADLPDYSVAGCQEPLIMGRDNGNTTNSWLNLGKILELTLSGGTSALTGKKIGPQSKLPAKERLENIRELFFANVDWYADQMCEAANKASRCIAMKPVPFLSAFMGGLESGIDMRDPEEQGTKYNASGCLIHGLSVVADSFAAIECLLKDHPQDAERLITACRNDFDGEQQLQDTLKSYPKFGNGIPEVDKLTADIAERVSQIVRSRKNYLGNPFRPDWSTPSTHLLYGYWVGATPDGRKSRQMLGYGLDPLFSTASGGLGFRTLSALQLPYEQMEGGCASHFGIDPKYFTGKSYEERGLQFRDRVLKPLFFNPVHPGREPFYLYVNVTTAETLRKVLAEPEKYAPSGVYIMRIHGTFVNFLDLSPAIQQDIIARLDPGSTFC